MDPLKDAFQKVKQDIDSLRHEMEVLRLQIQELSDINRTQQMIPTDNPQNPTIQQINPTETQTPTDTLPSQAPITPNSYVSTGNGGVPTDRQTNQQTDKSLEEYLQKFVLDDTLPFSEPQHSHQEFAQPSYSPELKDEELSQKFAQSRSSQQEIEESSQRFAQPSYSPELKDEELSQKFAQYLPTQQKTEITIKEDRINQIERVSEVLNSLDEIKKDLRHKFKRLTNQEMLVFSAIYQLEEQSISIDYPTLAAKLSLSESSIRDYVLKITKKGIPIVKTKENNKRILLHISEDFKKIASLQAILTLREL